MSNTSHTVVPKEGRRFAFGEVLHACKCPTCSLLMDWEYEDDGVYSSHCCGTKYEMYCETVSIVNLGPTDKPNKRFNTRRMEYTAPSGKKEVATLVVEEE